MPVPALIFGQHADHGDPRSTKHGAILLPGDTLLAFPVHGAAVGNSETGTTTDGTFSGIPPPVSVRSEAEHFPCIVAINNLLDR